MTPAQVQRAQREAHEAKQQRIADARSAQLDSWVSSLESILWRGVTRDARIDMSRKRRRPRVPPLDLGPLAQPIPPPSWAAFAPSEPSWLGKAFGGERRYAEQLAAANQRFAAEQQTYERAEADRQARVRQLRSDHQEQVDRAEAEASQANAHLNQWIEDLQNRRREGVERYLTEVLAAVPLPPAFPRKAEVAYDPATEHAVVRFELPGLTVVPEARAVTYVKTKDEFREQARPARDCQRLYRSVISEVSLLVIRDLFDADERLSQVSFNGHVSRTHPATGQADYPCLISLIVTREEFTPIVLTHVQPDECLHHLKALVSDHPHAVEAVRPLVDFDRSRYAFTHPVDVVAGLDSRDDLMTLTPTEFEHLVRQLFEALPGMEGWTTRASKDDGIDAVIFNNTPITGGLTVVQAKQYTATVGVQHVRELMGAMEHKRAGRGVLITTSSFTKDARVLGEDYGGRIQLIDGAGLVSMMKEHLDKDVLIGRRSRQKS
jgi:restriction system protein